MDKFFEKKRSWSKYKDELLVHYITIYFQKLLMTGKTICYVDFFSGKGKFQDGSKGSPMLVIDSAIEAMGKSRSLGNKIVGIFNDKEYEMELANNLKLYDEEIDYVVLDMDFEDAHSEIVNQLKNVNVFYYLDPFGVKNMKYKYIELLNNEDAYTSEFLMNFNSIGFLRNACRAFKIDESEFEEIEELHSDDDEFEENKTKEWLKEVSNGVYYSTIIGEYYAGNIDFKQAEIQFVDKYVDELKKVFKYVMNIPIRSKITNCPKYRMIYGTNNLQGFLIMGDNMNKKWNLMKEEEQTFLFEFDLENRIVEFSIDEVLLENIKSFELSFDFIIAFVYLKYGPLYSFKEFRAGIKKLFKEDKVILRREPYLTKKTKKPSKGYPINQKDEKLWVKLK